VRGRVDRGVDLRVELGRGGHEAGTAVGSLAAGAGLSNLIGSGAFALAREQPDIDGPQPYMRALANSYARDLATARSRR
jgi:hypothetical protein